MLFLPDASERGDGIFHYLQLAPWNLLAILTMACLSRYLIEVPMTRLGHRLSANLSGPESSPRRTLSPTVAMRGV
jgi:hypothetical protein